MFQDPAEYTTPYDDETEHGSDRTVGAEGERHVGVRRLGLRPACTVTRRTARWSARLVRDAGGARPGVRVRLRRPLDPRVRDRSGPEPRILAPTTRAACECSSSRPADHGAGAYIDEGGNNFWGIEQFTTAGGNRLFAGSDRDMASTSALHGAVRGEAAGVLGRDGDGALQGLRERAAHVLADPNANPLRESIVSPPSSGGALTGDSDSGSVTFTHTGNRVGDAGSFTFKANDGAADSNVATARIVAVPSSGGRCFNPFEGTPRGRRDRGRPSSATASAAARARTTSEEAAAPTACEATTTPTA